MNREKIVIGLNDISNFIVNKLGFEDAKAFLKMQDEIINVLKDQKEIVSCLECKHYYKNHCLCDDTIYWYRGPDFFCADAERK